MDCRIDPLDALGLSLGDAVVLRNAGAQVSDDVLRSLQMAHEVLGVRRRSTSSATRTAPRTAATRRSRRTRPPTAPTEIRGVIPSLQARSGLLDLGTGTVR